MSQRGRETQTQTQSDTDRQTHTERQKNTDWPRAQAQKSEVKAFAAVFSCRSTYHRATASVPVK